ncbi:MAG: P-II family nitrogen regulator [bacterium]
MKEILAIIRPEKMGATREALEKQGLDVIVYCDALGRGKEKGAISPREMADENLPRLPFVKKRFITFLCPDSKVEACLKAIQSVNRTGKIGDGKVFVLPVEEVS